jgi:hypothetical protein
MKSLIVSTLGILFISACERQPSQDLQTSTVTAATSSVASQAAGTQTQTIAQSSVDPVQTGSEPEEAVAENEEQGTWVGQIAVAQPVSMFNYVGAQSGDFAPMRFETGSEAGKKILAACPNGATCEFTGTIEWLDEVPPPDASAIGRIVRVSSAKRVATAVP